tara:strand:+ start:950 stop:1147 length:198 start_codon:yes stop_codon:yes gene_type:complete
MTEVQQNTFRTFMRSALENNIHDEVNYFIENMAEFHFSQTEVDDGTVRDRLFEEATLINITFSDE